MSTKHAQPLTFTQCVGIGKQHAPLFKNKVRHRWTKADQITPALVEFLILASPSAKFVPPFSSLPSRNTVYLQGLFRWKYQFGLENLSTKKTGRRLSKTKTSYGQSCRGQQSCRTTGTVQWLPDLASACLRTQTNQKGSRAF